MLPRFDCNTAHIAYIDISNDLTALKIVVNARPEPLPIGFFDNPSLYAALTPMSREEFFSIRRAVEEAIAIPEGEFRWFGSSSCNGPVLNRGSEHGNLLKTMQKPDILPGLRTDCQTLIDRGFKSSVQLQVHQLCAAGFISQAITQAIDDFCDNPAAYLVSAAPLHIL